MFRAQCPVIKHFYANWVVLAEYQNIELSRLDIGREEAVKKKIIYFVSIKSSVIFGLHQLSSCLGIVNWHSVPKIKPQLTSFLFHYNWLIKQDFYSKLWNTNLIASHRILSHSISSCLSASDCTHIEKIYRLNINSRFVHVITSTIQAKPN